MGLVTLLVLGALVGWVASIITKRDAEQGWVGNIVVGVVGAFLGGVISNVLLGRDLADLTFDLSSLVWSLVGALVLCMVLNYLTRNHQDRL